MRKFSDKGTKITVWRRSAQGRGKMIGNVDFSETLGYNEDDNENKGGYIMNPRVEEYLAGVQKEIDAAKAKEAEEARKEREQTLISLGLYTEEKEYAPDELQKDSWAVKNEGYTDSENGFVYKHKRF